MFWSSIFVCSDSNGVGPINLLRMWLVSVGIHWIVYIQFADAFLDWGDPKFVEIRWRSHIARSNIFSDVVMSKGINGMTPAISLNDSGAIARSKIIQSNYTFACRKLYVFACLLRLDHHNTRHAPLSRLAGPLSRRFFLITRVVSPGIILSRRLVERRRSKAGPRRKYDTKIIPIFSGKIIRGPYKSLPRSRTCTGRHQGENNKSPEYERRSKDGRKQNRRIMTCFPWETQHHQWP